MYVEKADDAANDAIWMKSIRYEIANKYQKPWGMPAQTSEDFAKMIGKGALLMISGSDSSFITAGASERVRQCRDAIMKIKNT